MHVAMWLLWFLWFLRVEYSAKRLYKPLSAFLVFVDLVWFLCGRICGFWSRVVFGCGLARPIGLLWSLWFFAEVVVFAFDAYLDARGLVVLWSCGLVVLPRCPWSCLDARGFASMPVILWSCGLVVLCSLWFGGLAIDAEADDCASFCSLWFGGLALDADACQWSCASTCPQGLRVRSTSCGFGGSMVLPSMPMPMLMLMLMIARPLVEGLCGSVVLRVHLPAGIARPLGEGLCGSVVLPSIPMLASGLARPLARRDCASTWRRSLWFFAEVVVFCLRRLPRCLWSCGLVVLWSCGLVVL